MSNHFSMGAINKKTNNYEYPKIANKTNKYKCPFCEKDIIFKNGKIKQPHFAHYKSNNPCSYYEKPNETQIHKDAKLLMKNLLDNKREINFYRKCYYCHKSREYLLNITGKEYNDNVTSVIEYRFNYNESNRSADVALLQNKEIKYIFEIKYKNKTSEENRPEPWFEIQAETLINETNECKNTNEKGEIEIECIRDYKCILCKNKEQYEINNAREVLEKLQIREKEQIREKNELLNMSNEDDRTIQIQQKIEKFKKKTEEDRKKKEEAIENERIKQKERMEKQKERIEREKEFMKNFLENNVKCNIRCDICNINYCKCNNPKFIKNEYKRIICDVCKKYKCMCVRITDFFKK
jgi:hypothetical protein